MPENIHAALKITPQPGKRETRRHRIAPAETHKNIIIKYINTYIKIINLESNQYWIISHIYTPFQRLFSIFIHHFKDYFPYLYTISKTISHIYTHFQRLFPIFIHIFKDYFPYLYTLSKIISHISYIYTNFQDYFPYLYTLSKIISHIYNDYFPYLYTLLKTISHIYTPFQGLT